MDIRINNILELQLANEEVSAFVELFGNLKKTILLSEKKVGFKKTGQITIDLKEECIDLIMDLCETSGIIDESENKEDEISK